MATRAFSGVLSGSRENKNPWRLILLGAPGLGKGTQAELLTARRGELVPDSTVWEMVRERSSCILNCGGFILDGFPRTLGQAQSLKALMEKEKLSLSAVVNCELPVDEIVQRLSGRRTCEQCKSVFHVAERSPKVEAVCDRCGGGLFQRRRPSRGRLCALGCLPTKHRPAHPVLQRSQPAHANCRQGIAGRDHGADGGEPKGTILWPRGRLS
jgi:adenylate kinase family enzyme